MIVTLPSMMLIHPYLAHRLGLMDLDGFGNGAFTSDACIQAGWFCGGFIGLQ